MLEIQKCEFRLLEGEVCVDLESLRRRKTNRTMKSPELVANMMCRKRLLSFHDENEHPSFFNKISNTCSNHSPLWDRTFESKRFFYSPIEEAEKAEVSACLELCEEESKVNEEQRKLSPCNQIISQMEEFLHITTHSSAQDLPPKSSSKKSRTSSFKAQELDDIFGTFRTIRAEERRDERVKGTLQKENRKLRRSQTEPYKTCPTTPQRTFTFTSTDNNVFQTPQSYLQASQEKCWLNSKEADRNIIEKLLLKVSQT